MTKNLPTKSEILSISFYQNIGVDVIMLSDETAVLTNWNKILIWLNNYLKKTIKSSGSLKKQVDKSNIFWNLVDKLPNIPIVIFSKKQFSNSRSVDGSNPFTFRDDRECVDRIHRK